jgi:predicted choloylglycine hydrolase
MLTIEQFEASGSHHEVGFAIGQRFADQIHCSLDTYRFLQERILPYHRTPEVQARYQQLLELNQIRYPDYFAELEGIAQGSGRPFEDLLLVNLRGEYRRFLTWRHGGYVHGCSDCTLVTDDAALIGHNEDGAPSFRGSMYLVHARVEGKPAFTALSYPGFLCGNALGFNAEGICFSVDHVQPRDARVGVGRHFIARSLLEARSLDDAIERVTAPGRASGFSYTIGSIPERRVVLVEVAPENHHVREIRGAYFHANHYRDLTDVDQIIHPSSRARVERARVMMRERGLAGNALSPSKGLSDQNAAGVLAILGDQTNGQYPIHRTATAPDQAATLCTALFDLDARQLRIYTDHPTQAPGEVVALAM